MAVVALFNRHYRKRPTVAQIIQSCSANGTESWFFFRAPGIGINSGSPVAPRPSNKTLSNSSSLVPCAIWVKVGRIQLRRHGGQKGEHGGGVWGKLDAWRDTVRMLCSYKGNKELQHRPSGEKPGYWPRLDLSFHQDRVSSLTYPF